MFRIQFMFWKKFRSFVWSKHFLKHSAYILGIYIVVIFILVQYLDYYTNNGEKIAVPNLTGLNANKAKLKLEELDLKIELLDSVYRPDLPTGTIISQDPQPTSKSTVYVKSGRIIRVQVSKKNRMIEMPGLIDRSERFAESVLKNRGLKYTKQYVPTNEANGAVLKQLYKGKAIKEGQRLPVGSVITLIIGQNDASEPVEIPDLVGMTISAAKGRLGGTSLSLLIGSCEGCLTAEDSTSATIHSQSPEYMEGVTAPAGTTITVSAGK